MEEERLFKAHTSNNHVSVETEIEIIEELVPGLVSKALTSLKKPAEMFLTHRSKACDPRSKRFGIIGLHFSKQLALYSSVCENLQFFCHKARIPIIPSEGVLNDNPDQKGPRLTYCLQFLTFPFYIRPNLPSPSKIK